MSAASNDVLTARDKMLVSSTIAGGGNAPLRYVRGGGVCESNTPRRLFTPHDGFEDRGAHQDPSASVGQLWRGPLRVSNPRRKWAALLRHRGSIEPDPRRAVTIVILLAVFLAAIFVGTALATDRPQFCPSCHEMQPYFDAWANGPHKDVWCIDCHVPEGMPARFAHKFVALGEVYSHVREDILFPKSVPPEVPDARCLNCHSDVPAKIDGFPHAAHAKKGACAQCHYDTGHDVTDQALQSAGVFDPSAAPQRPSGKVATVGAGKANLARHATVSCSRCHDMAATPCAACHAPRGTSTLESASRPAPQCHETTGASWKFVHPKVKGECSECHKAPAKHPAGNCTTCHKQAGKSWSFSHPGRSADCTQCHKAPSGHPAGACAVCHKQTGRSWAFAHPPRAGEHSYRSIPCKKCHPNSYAAVYCTCHNGRPPSD